MSQAIIHFDGACSGNPGPMGAGAIVEIDGKRHVLSRAFGKGTNNEAEYHGAILGLRNALALGATSVTLCGDSQLILRQLDGQYKVRAPNLLALHQEARRLMSMLRPSRTKWVPRAENAEADAAARAAIA